ncbi:Luc7-like protein [Ananas comosus]|uniref:Luc7-like protein n=1 Tax=Ananas comosus TaxID=4615 RepID=A0A199W132_ANACO|nr:Luc7-like protein [Ananas comosus]
MDAIRKQLDALMGANRNGDVAEVNRKYYDRDVCRLFLAGLCPHDLFQLTKQQFCSRVFGTGKGKSKKFLLPIYSLFGPVECFGKAKYLKLLL